MRDNLQIMALLIISIAIFASGCSQRQTHVESDASKGVDIVISPEDGAGESKPAEQPEAVEGEQGPGTAIPIAPQETIPSSGGQASTELNASITAQTQTPNTAPITPEKITEITSELNLTEITCDETQTLGYLGCTQLRSGDDLIKLKNAGRGDLAGAYIKYYKSSKFIGEQLESFNLTVGDGANLTLQTVKFDPDKVEIFPVEDGSMCANKQLVVIPSTNCR